MAYGDYDGPDKEDKGQENGSCNRTLCQAPGAMWYNHGSYSWYCVDCRHEIENDSFNKRDWDLNWKPHRGHPMFETREMMDEREAANNRDAEIISGNPYIDLDGMRDVILEHDREEFIMPERYGTAIRNSGKKAQEQYRAGSVEAGVLKETRQQRRARERAERKSLR